MPTTSPDDIWYTQRSDLYSIESITGLMASSIQAAIDNMRTPEIATDVFQSISGWPVMEQEFVRIDRTVYWSVLIQRDGGTISVNDLGRILPSGVNLGTVRAPWIPPRQAALGGGAGSPQGRPVTGGAILPDGNVHARYTSGTANILNGHVMAFGGVYTLV